MKAKKTAARVKTIVQAAAIVATILDGRKLYKVLSPTGESQNGGSLQWSLPADGKAGDWHEVPDVSMCNSGLHLTAEPVAWHKANCRVFEVEAEGFQKCGTATKWSEDKVVAKRVRLVRELTVDELVPLGIIRTGVHEVKGNARVVVEGSARVSAYGSAQVTAYDSAQVTAYDSAQVTAYGSAQVTATGSAQVTATGSAQVTAYDSAQVTAYDSAQVTAYGSAQVTATGSAQVTAYDSAQVTAYGSAQVTATGSAQVTAYDSAQVTATGSAQVTAYDSAQVTAYGSAQVTATGSAQVTAYDSAQVTAYGSAQVTATGSAQVTATGQAIVGTWKGSSYYPNAAKVDVGEDATHVDYRAGGKPTIHFAPEKPSTEAAQ